MILMDYSPEQIVGVCRKQGIKMVSHETIYQYIWWDKAHGGELYKQKGHGFLSPNQVFSKSTGLDARVFV